jgi:Site-specific recombinase XerD
LGGTTAKAIEGQIGRHFPIEMSSHPRQAMLVTYTTGVVPLEQFLLPDELNGSQGMNRSATPPFIPATDDYQAIGNWLARLEPASHTYRSYRREAERLLLWAILVKQKALSSLDMVDMGEYRIFLADPQPADLWVGPPKKKGQQNWKPFIGPLSPRSRRFSETVVNGLFTFLVNQHYLLHNPLTALAKLKNPDALKPMDTNRSFTEGQWQLIQTFLDTQLANAHGLEKQKWLRTHMIILLAFGTGLRLHELANAKLGDLETRQRQGQTQHWLMVLGKGQKLRDVPIPLPLYRLMAETYQQLTGRQLSWPAPDNPIIPPLRGSPSNALTPLAIHKIIKEAFTIAAGTLSIANPEVAEKLMAASTHWLRHTHGSMAVDRNIPLTMIRDNLGHSNIATTSNYVHSDNDARHEAFHDFYK